MTDLLGYLARLSSGVMFKYTPENLDAIEAGLAPNASDEILSVCGSGFQSLALLISGAKVTAVDINQKQLDLLRNRIEALLNENFIGFYIEPNGVREMLELEKIHKYFHGGKRIHLVAKNAENLTILPSMSLEDVCATRKFSKIYASDALNNLYSDDTIDHQIVSVATGMKHGGLLYCANGLIVETLLGDPSNVGLSIESERTDAARSFDNGLYEPTVFVKR